MLKIIKHIASSNLKPELEEMDFILLKAADPRMDGEVINRVFWSLRLGHVLVELGFDETSGQLVSVLVDLLRGFEWPIRNLVELPRALMKDVSVIADLEPWHGLSNSWIVVRDAKPELIFNSERCALIMPEWGPAVALYRNGYIEIGVTDRGQVVWIGISGCHPPLLKTMRQLLQSRGIQIPESD